MCKRVVARQLHDVVVLKAPTSVIVDAWNLGMINLLLPLYLLLLLLLVLLFEALYLL